MAKGSSKQPAITVKGGKVTKNPQFAKAATEDREVNQQKVADQSPSVTASHQTPNKGGDKLKNSEPPLRNDTSSNSAGPQAQPVNNNPEHAPPVQNRDDDASESGSGSDVAILGTKHIHPGGHCGHGMGC